MPWRAMTRAGEAGCRGRRPRLQCGGDGGGNGTALGGMLGNGGRFGETSLPRVGGRGLGGGVT